MTLLEGALLKVVGGRTKWCDEGFRKGAVNTPLDVGWPSRLLID
jgi:hypothetical protein